MKKINVLIPLLLILLSSGGCEFNENDEHDENDNNKADNWEAVLDKKLPLFGHRNWILVVDKAFPLQTGKSIEVVNTGKKLIPVLSNVLSKIGESDHVKPIVYTDKELGYLNDSLVDGISDYKNKLHRTIPGDKQVMLHDSVFTKIRTASELFQVLVLKTEATMPYTSVFIELGCKYWPSDKENTLRKAMQ